MVAWHSYNYIVGPAVALVAVGVLVLLLRWAFGGGVSLVERRSRRGSPEEYGLLVPVASPATFTEGEWQRQALRAAGLQGTLSMTTAGPRLLVWPDDEKRARLVLGQHHLP